MKDRTAVQRDLRSRQRINPLSRPDLREISPTAHGLHADHEFVVFPNLEACIMQVKD